MPRSESRKATITWSAQDSADDADVLEQRDRLRVSPVQVVEHEADGHRRRQLDERAGDGREEQEPLGLRIGALRLRHVRAHRRGSSRARRASSPPCRATCRSSSSAGACSTSCEHTAIHGSYGTAELLRARAPQHGEPLAVRAVCRERRQAALADPGLAGDQHHLPCPRARGAARALHEPRAPSSRPTNAARGADRSSAGSGQPPTPAVSSASVVHGTANASTGSGNPFNSSSPTDSKRMPSSRPASIRTAGDTRIPSAGALRAQPRRLDRRHPEVVAVLDRRLARAEPDPHLQLLLGAPVAALEQLLHRHRTLAPPPTPT